MNTDDLGNRMKNNYENIPKTRLVRRIPVIVRLDGRAFHSYTKGFLRPFDNLLIESIQETTKYLCENIQGCVLAYAQSDEISLLLIDYQKLESQAFFDYEIQKICSITASMATMAFNKVFGNNVREEISSYKSSMVPQSMTFQQKMKKYHDALTNAMTKGAMFDSRCFNIPKEEVTNYFYWRQLDATRNSIQMVGQANFSHKELENKSCNDIQNMLLTQKNINWNDYPVHLKRGSCCIKEYYMNDGVQRSRWIIDKNIPIFKNEDRLYIDKHLEVYN